MSAKQQTCLCFDFGLKRFGVAIGNSFIHTAQELKPIAARDGIPDWDIIDSLVTEWAPFYFVVGLPLNMDGSESEMSLRAKKFGKRLKGRYNKSVHMMDERLTSYEAKSRVREQQGKVNFGQHSVDGAAACLILQSWFSTGETQHD